MTAMTKLPLLALLISVLVYPAAGSLGAGKGLFGSRGGDESEDSWPKSRFPAD
jgi:hypothetical protein